MIGRGKTVLVVDAAEAMRQMLGAALRALRFERVVPADTVDEARRALADGTIDLALIEWQVGEQSGFDLAADIRTGRVPPRSDLPIVMMSWKAEPKRALAVQGLKLDGLLVKPVSRDALEKMIASAFSPAAKAPPRRVLGQAS